MNPKGVDGDVGQGGRSLREDKSCSVRDNVLNDGASVGRNGSYSCSFTRSFILAAQAGYSAFNKAESGRRWLSLLIVMRMDRYDLNYNTKFVFTALKSYENILVSSNL